MDNTNPNSIPIPPGGPAASTFRDKSLQASGIREESQKSIVRFLVHDSKYKKKVDLEGDSFFLSMARGKSTDPEAPEPEKPRYREELLDRYVAGSFNKQWQAGPGDDMVMLYIDLDRQPMQYEPPKQSRSKDYVRVRMQFPERNLDKEGKAMKYQSPPGSGSKIWLPEKIIQAYEQKQIIETLIVTEGEKKADKTCQEGLFAVGISGIFNLAINNNLPIEFDRIIRRCLVKNIVFLLDSDLFDLSTKKGASANSRPNLFYTAVRNFRDYFRALSLDEIDLEIYFAYSLPNAQGEKGIDDLLAGSMAGQEGVLIKELENQLVDKHASGKYLHVHTITADSEVRLKQYFGVNNATEFAEKYKDKLKALGDKFKFWKTEWRFKEDGSVELAQPLRPEETFWAKEYEDDKPKLTFNYFHCYNFLRARGFGRYEVGAGDANDYMFIRKEGKLVFEVKPHHIKDFIQDFTESIGEIDVLNMLYRGSKYLGPESLGNLKYLDVEFLPPAKESQYLCFLNKYWKVTADGIDEQPLHDLPSFTWKNKTLDFEPVLIPDFIKILTTEHNGQTYYDYELSLAAEQSHYLAYLTNASRIYWRQTNPLEASDEPVKALSPEQEYEQALSLFNKLTAIGYLLHSYRNPAKTKAVICMDAKVSEVGQSYGRTGKSLVGVALEQMIPTVFIDGKKKDMEKDPFLYEEVDERTELIFIDDIDRSLDFESFFTIITGRLTVNKKGKSKFKIDKSQTPKLLITTNHAISGDSDSFLDRQILLGFSDYYNARRKPVDEFGYLFFDEWGPEQWNLFYNLMAACLQLYLQHDIISAPNTTLVKRRLRQEMGEEFFTWCETYFMEDGGQLNVRFPKDEMYNALMEGVPNFKKYPLGAVAFKKKVKKYCEYKAYRFNPQQNGGDDKSNGKEYFTIANSTYVVL
jgi:DNA primase